LASTNSNLTAVAELERQLAEYERRARLLETELVEVKELLDEHVRLCPAAAVDES
jgi:hypothetical protein